MNSSAAILIVDDEPDLIENIGLALAAEDYQIFTAADGHEALAILREQPINLILADIAMPGMNGYQLYDRVRENPAWVTTPFIFLTARSMDSDICYGKEMGVDDYLTKPIQAADLVSVVRGKLRRVGQLHESMTRRPASPEAQVITVEQLRIDTRQYRAWLCDQELKLSAKEFALLDYLARQAGRVVAPQELVQVTHELKTDNIEAGSLVRPLILSLRRKLGLAPGERGSIENVRGVGYRLVTTAE
jgi:DNA-binding response OmpR family regulator